MKTYIYIHIYLYACICRGISIFEYLIRFLSFFFGGWEASEKKKMRKIMVMNDTNKVSVFFFLKCLALSEISLDGRFDRQVVAFKKKKK